MSEVRQDPLTGRCVIIARDRAKRPHAFVTDSPSLDDSECPFCVGQEQQTPHPIAIYAPPKPTRNVPWWVRVVPNKFPAVLDPGSLRQASTTAAGSAARELGDAGDDIQKGGGEFSFFASQAAIGSHEV